MNEKDNDLIRRRDAHKATHNFHVSEINAIPAVDAVEVRHGKWIECEDGGYCSECECDMPMYREDWTEWKYCKTPYCPNCGARMDGEEEHNAAD